MTTDTTIERIEATKSTTLSGWSVLLWNDDVHGMDEVVYALVRTIPVDTERAVEIMFAAHTHGKAVAWSGAKEIAELYRDGLEGYGLTATLSN